MKVKIFLTRKATVSFSMVLFHVDRQVISARTQIISKYMIHVPSMECVEYYSNMLNTYLI